MPWSDDTRCLFCDGKLPLYRKLAQGQFCSKNHQKMYWQEQERLAVERLHQTHNELRAYRPPEPIESILGPDILAHHSSPHSSDDAPAIAAIIPETIAARIATVPDFVAADPFEYEMAVRPFAPRPGTGMVDAQRATRSLPGAGPTRLGFEFTGCGMVLPLANIPLDPAPLHLSLTPAFAPAARQRGLGFAGAARLPHFALAPMVARALGDASPFDPNVPLVRAIALNLEPRHEVLEHILLDQLPLWEKLRALGFDIAVAGAAWIPMRRVTPKRFAVRRAPELPFNSGLHGFIGEYAPSAAGLCVLAAKLGEHSSHAVCGETQPHESKLQLSVALRLNIQPATAAYEPGTPGLMQLNAALQVHRPTPRPVNAAPVEMPLRRKAIPALARPAEPVRVIRHRATNIFALNYRATMDAAAGPIRPQLAGPLLSQPLTSDPLLPEHRAEPLRDQPYQEAVAAAARAALPWVKIQAMVGHGLDFWQNAPRDLKLLAFAIPALLALVFAPSLPKISVAMPQLTASFPVQFREVVSSKVEGFKKSMADRAGIALNEDFRAGLDDWISKGEATTEWSFDATGFVRPGPLALYAPSMNLRDYQMQFMGTLDQGALSWVTRAKDFQNYYVVKLTVAKPGPIPTLRLTRYAVIDGKAQDRVDTRVPIDARADTNYRIRMDVNGDDFALMIQEQMIDSWSEPRLHRGGIGFYTSSGEQSRIRWVQVTHQNDMLGRLCAYLAPVDFPTTTGSW